MSAVAVLRIARGTAKNPGRFEVFEVPYTDGQSILDGLMWDPRARRPEPRVPLRVHQRERMQGMRERIGGKNGYACTERLKPGETVLEPLANKRLIRDLACDTVPPKERLVRG